MTDPIFCQTVGLEIEVTHVDPNAIRLPRGWNITSDASVEQDMLAINGIPFIDHSETQHLVLGNHIMGGEILSSIIDTKSNYLMDLKSLCSNLISKGEPDCSERAGLHVHLSFTNPGLEILKNIIKLGCHLEDVFFLLGGMGYEFRGVKNDCSYCRPITTPGPQIVNDEGGNLYPCFVVDDLLATRTIKGFQIRLGDYWNLGESKYVPIRYHWLNLWNLWKQKQTLEFRIFNHSLKPRYIEVAIEISKAFGDSVIYYTYHPEELDELEYNSVYKHRDKSDIIETFLNFTSSRVEPRIVDLALKMMSNTPIESIRFPSIPYYFHLRFHRNGNRSPCHWAGVSYRPSITYHYDEVEEPYFEDIHNLRADNPRQRSAELPIVDIFSNSRQSTPPSFTEESRPMRLNDILSSEEENNTPTLNIQGNQPVNSSNIDEGDDSFTTFVQNVIGNTEPSIFEDDEEAEE